VCDLLAGQTDDERTSTRTDSFIVSFFHSSSSTPSSSSPSPSLSPQQQSFWKQLHTSNGLLAFHVVTTSLVLILIFVLLDTNALGSTSLSLITVLTVILPDRADLTTKIGTSRCSGGKLGAFPRLDKQRKNSLLVPDARMGLDPDNRSSPEWPGSIR
jgi:uncharacterized membrane protein YccC